MSVEHHERLIEKKHTIWYKIWKKILLTTYVLITFVIIYYSITDKQIAASFWVFSAAIIFALQNFVASIFARLYIKWAGLYERWDIIKSWNPFMSAVGEVQEIWLFFTKLKEVDEFNLTFTWKTVSFPNYLIFNSGIFNYTKNNLLFWHEFKITLTCRKRDIDTLLNNFKDIIESTYNTILKDKVYLIPWQKKQKPNKPTYQLTIMPLWVEIKVRLMLHFYNVFAANNELMRALIKWHNEDKIEIQSEKDYMWVNNKDDIVER